MFESVGLDSELANVEFEFALHLERLGMELIYAEHTFLLDLEPNAPLFLQDDVSDT